MENYYNDLKLPALSPLNEVKKAYRKLAKIYHPDKNLKSKLPVQNFLKIKKAYEFLTDTEKKEKYDNQIIRYKRKIKIRHDPILIKEYLRKVPKFKSQVIFTRKTNIDKNQCEKCEGYGQILTRFSTPSICPRCNGAGRT
tara:strand:- start:185 stop:604 length:420 start_codon:yes stop_codon:yes gene_type:complete